MGLGFAGIASAKDIIEASAKLEQQKTKLRELSAKDASEAPFAEGLTAEAARRYPNLTQASAIDTYIDVRANSLGTNGLVDQERAKRNLMTIARAQTAALVNGVELTPEDAQNLMKAVEGSGRASDPTAMSKMFDAYIRAKQQFGTGISSDKIRDYVQNAKAANFGIGEEQFFWQDIVRMTEGNSARLGNETAQTMQTLVGGHAQKQTAKWLLGLGLADGFTPMGASAARIEGLHGSDVLQTNSMDWANTVLLPALKAHGYLNDKDLKKREDVLRKDSPGMSEDTIKERAMDQAIANAAMQSGMRSTVTDLLTHSIVNEPLIKRDVLGMPAAPTLPTTSPKTPWPRGRSSPAR